MRLLLVLMLSMTSLFSQAHQIDIPNKGDMSSVITSCLPMVLLVCALVAAAVYFVSANKKRNSTGEKINSEKNT